MIFHSKKTMIIDSIGGKSERAWEGAIAPTLKARDFKFPPSIVEIKVKENDREETNTLEPV